jgi:hypothetical protein
MGDIYPQDGGQPGGGQTGASGDDPLKAEAQAAKEKLGGAVQAVKGEAAHFADTAKQKVAEKADQQKETVTTALGDFAQAIRAAGDQLCEKDQTMAARLVTQAAEGLETLSRSVSEKRPEDMLNSIRDFGRSNPTAFVAGAVLAGIALGRFARASSEHDHDQSAGASMQRQTSGADQAFAHSEGFLGTDQGSTTVSPQSPMQEREVGFHDLHADLGASSLGASEIVDPQAAAEVGASPGREMGFQDLHTDLGASDEGSTDPERQQLGSSESGASVLGEDDRTDEGRGPRPGL